MKRTDEPKVWLNNVNCQGNEPGLQFCSSSGGEGNPCYFVAYAICTGININLRLKKLTLLFIL